MAVGERDQLPLDRPLLRQVVALDLDVEVALAEGPEQGVEAGGGEVGPAGAQGGVEGAAGAAGECDQALGALRERRRRDARRVTELTVEIGAAGEPQQVSVAGLVAGEQHDVREGRDRGAGAGIGRLERHRELDPGDRLDPGPGRLLGEFQRAEQVVGVGERQRRLPVTGRRLDEVADLQRALEQGIGRVGVQVDVADRLQVGQFGSRSVPPLKPATISRVWPGVRTRGASPAEKMRWILR